MRSRLNKEYLLWLRVQRGWSQEEAAANAGIYNKRQYVRLEDGETLRPHRTTLEALASGFGVRPESLLLGPSEVARPEHESAYRSYKANNQAPITVEQGKRYLGLLAMDADGTVIRGLEYSWKLVWAHLGINDEVRRLAMRRYLSGELTYSDWCSYCCRFFSDRGLRHADFVQIGAGLQVLPGLRQGLSALRRRGVITAIVSGGIDALLDAVFPDHRDYFDFTFINRFIWSKAGKLVAIQPTPFDFEGKRTCLLQLASRHSLEANQVAFVGEGLNDKHVAGSIGLSIGLLPRSQDVRESFDVIVDEEEFTPVMQLLLSRFSIRNQGATTAE